MPIVSIKSVTWLMPPADNVDKSAAISAAKLVDASLSCCVGVEVDSLVAKGAMGI